MSAPLIHLGVYGLHTRWISWRGQGATGARISLFSKCSAAFVSSVERGNRDREELEMGNSQDHREEMSRPFGVERGVESEAVGFDRVKQQVAEKLHRAAESLQERTGDVRTPTEAAKLGAQASNWLHNSADYVERIEPAKIKEGFVQQVKRNPGKSLLFAGAAGIILGAIFRRR